MYKNIAIGALTILCAVFIALVVVFQKKCNEYQTELNFSDKSYAHNALIAAFSLKHICQTTNDPNGIKIAKLFILTTYKRLTPYIKENENTLNDISLEIINASINKEIEPHFNFSDSELISVYQYRVAAESYRKYITK